MPLQQILLYSFYAVSFTFLVFFLKSKILERYFLFETIKPFFLCFFTLTFVLLLERLLDLMNVTIEKQLDMFTVANLFLLSLPFTLALTVPASVLSSSIMAFGRMSVDQELTAMKSTGINIFRMTSLLLLFFLMIATGMAYFNDFVLPETNHLLKNMMLRISYKKPITAINPGTFTTMNQLTIYAKDRSEEALHDILIFNTEAVRFPQTIEAKRGEIYLDPASDQLKVILTDGVMYERDATDGSKFQVSKFEQYTFYRSGFGYGMDDASTDYRGDREMSSAQMREIIGEKQQDLERLDEELRDILQALSQTDATDYDEYRKYQVNAELKASQKKEIEKTIRMFTVEIHKKYSLAAACFIFILVGLPIGVMTKTSGVSMAFGVSAIVYSVYYACLTLGEECGDRGIIHPVLSMWLPPLIFMSIGWFLIYLAHHEKHFDISVLWKWCGRIFKRNANTR